MRGVKPLFTSRRYRVWRGGSMYSIISRTMAPPSSSSVGEEHPVLGGGEDVGVAVDRDQIGMAGHVPETPAGPTLGPVDRILLA